MVPPLPGSGIIKHPFYAHPMDTQGAIYKIFQQEFVYAFSCCHAIKSVLFLNIVTRKIAGLSIDIPSHEFKDFGGEDRAEIARSRDA
jgi:hypothetical protein